MKRLALWLLSLPLASTAQTLETSCITAGRLDEAGRWAPQFRSVRLLDGAGQPVVVRQKSDLQKVRAAALSEPALLSTCEGNQALQRGEASPSPKTPAPALKPGTVSVAGVGFPKLQVGGELVELKVQLSSEQIVMVSR